MAISKTKKGYRAELYVDNHRVAGQRGFKTKNEAKLWLEKTRLEHSEDAIVSTKNSSVTFENLIEMYMNLHLPKIRVQTRDTYLSNLNTHDMPDHCMTTLSHRIHTAYK